MCTHNQCFEQKKEIVKKKNQMKIVIFTGVTNRCMVHGHVLVMELSIAEKSALSSPM